MTVLWPVERSPVARAWRGAKQGVAVQRASGGTGEPAPEQWDEWLMALFPAYCSAPFAERHREYWEHVDSITLEGAPDPFVSPWPRGGAKSTSAELGTAKVGVTGRRRYALYVSETQDQADKHVETIASLLESDGVERHYPDHARPMVGKFGNQKGWRRQRLRTAGGFTLDALGLDTASRGIKVEDQRPDLIVLDDIDNKHDSPATTAKKIATITTSILPAGSSNVAVWVIQNLIIPDGFVSRIVDGRADYLTQRVVSGPHPAIRDLEWEWVHDAETGTREAKITGGAATWEGQNLAKCQHLINTIGISSFLKECQHLVKDRSEGTVLRYDEARHLEDLSDEEARRLVRMGQVFGGIDFGAWRFAFVLRAADETGRLHQIAELFSQREELEARARAITAICKHYDCPKTLRVWGDSANPTDIMELNAALKRIMSPYRVQGVAAQNKIRLTGVERMNDLLARNALFYRRSVASLTHQALLAQWPALLYEGTPPDTRTWMLGYNAASAGTQMEGSRLLYELTKWAYPVPKEGEAQNQDPDDHTADGADAVSADRYAIMSWWKEGHEQKAPEKKDPQYDDQFEKVLKRLGGGGNGNRWRKK